MDEVRRCDLAIHVSGETWLIVRDWSLCGEFCVGGHGWHFVAFAGHDGLIGGILAKQALEGTEACGRCGEDDALYGGG